MTRRFDIYAPLQDFYWPGRDFSFSHNVTLKRFDGTPDLSGLESFVSKPEWERATNTNALSLDSQSGCCNASTPHPNPLPALGERG